VFKPACTSIISFIRIRPSLHTRSDVTLFPFWPAVNSQIQRIDSLIILVVTVITPLLDLAIAVAIGCGLAALEFVWQSSYRVKVNITTRPGVGPDEPEAVKVIHSLLSTCTTAWVSSSFVRVVLLTSICYVHLSILVHTATTDCDHIDHHRSMRWKGSYTMLALTISYPTSHQLLILLLSRSCSTKQICVTTVLCRCERLARARMSNSVVLRQDTLSRTTFCPA
jgi:hypothetical protein